MIGLQRFLSWSVALSVRNVCLTAEILCLVLIALSLSSVERLGGGITQHWRLLSGRLKRSSLCLPITNHIFLTLKPHLSYVYTFPLIFQLSLITRCCILTWSRNIVLFLHFAHSLSDTELGLILFCTQHHDSVSKSPFHLSCTSLSELQLLWLQAVILLVGPVLCVSNSAQYLLQHNFLMS